MEAWLNRWLAQYVQPDPGKASEADKGKRPLAEARIEIKDAEPGYYRGTLFLQPHYQLAGLTQPLQLSVTLPSRRPRR